MKIQINWRKFNNEMIRIELNWIEMIRIELNWNLTILLLSFFFLSSLECLLRSIVFFHLCPLCLRPSLTRKWRLLKNGVPSLSFTLPLCLLLCHLCPQSPCSSRTRRTHTISSWHSQIPPWIWSIWQRLSDWPQDLWGLDLQRHWRNCCRPNKGLVRWAPFLFLSSLLLNDSLLPHLPPSS